MMAGKRDKKDKTREKWRKGRNKNIIRYEKKGMGHGTKNKTRSQKCFNKNGQYIIYIELAFHKKTTTTTPKNAFLKQH